jgi:hypothetical protein
MEFKFPSLIRITQVNSLNLKSIKLNESKSYDNYNLRAINLVSLILNGKFSVPVNMNI